MVFLKKQSAEQLVRKYLPPVAIIAFGGVFALYLAAIVLAGGSAAGFFLFMAAFAMVVLLPGLMLCRWLGVQPDAPRRVMLALPLGGLLLLLSFESIGRVLPVWVCALPGLLLSAGWLFNQRGRLQNRPKLPQMPLAGWWLVVIVAAAMGIYLLSGVFPAAKAETAGNMVYNQDLLWSVGNAAAAQWGAPLRDIRVAGGILHYHYFTDVLCGLLAVFSGQSAWDAVCFYSWPLWCAAFALGLYLVAREFGAGRWQALLPVVGAIFGHFAWDVSYKHVFQNVNGVLQSYVFMLAALLALQLAAKRGFTTRQSRGLYLAFGAAATAMLWGKSTVGVLFVLAVLAAGVVWLVQRKPGALPLLAIAGSGLAVFGLLYLLIYRHAINNLVFQPSVHALGDTFRIMLGMYLPVVVLYLASLAVSLKNFGKLPFAALVVHALVPGGMVAYILFYHYSFSQSYFLLAAGFAMWLCVAQAAPVLFSRLWAKRAVVLLLGVSVLASLYYTLPLMRRGVQIALRTTGLRPSFTYEVETVSPDDAAAARWLRENSAIHEVFATNRNEKNPDAQEGVFHYYTAAAQRQAYVESWRYAMDYSLDYHQLRYQLETVSDGVFAADDAPTACRLAHENGISYLVVWLPGGQLPFKNWEPVFATSTVLIYRV